MHVAASSEFSPATSSTRDSARQANHCSTESRAKWRRWVRHTAPAPARPPNRGRAYFGVVNVALLQVQAGEVRRGVHVARQRARLRLRERRPAGQPPRSSASSSLFARAFQMTHRFVGRTAVLEPRVVRLGQPDPERLRAVVLAGQAARDRQVGPRDHRRRVVVPIDLPRGSKSR